VGVRAAIARAAQRNVKCQGRRPCPLKGFSIGGRCRGQLSNCAFPLVHLSLPDQEMMSSISPVEAPEALDALERRLSEIEPYETEVFVGEASATEVTVQLDYGDPIILRGKQVTLRPSGFEADDYAWLAHLHFQWGTSVNESLSAATRRIADAKHLLEDQARRISEKAKGHQRGSTAHTLYDQQLSFISRVLGKLDT
jgi:hypothetical protein